MVLFPNCKINLGLDVLSKRDDGYHNLKTVFVPIPWDDVLEILPAKKTTFQSSGLPIPGKIEDNLCLKAFHLLQTDFDLSPVQIYLRKHLPMGGGLGGGSSNASFTLIGLNQLFELNLPNKRLEKYALELGSDCPFFIKNSICLTEGKGEVFSDFDLDLKGYYIKLVNLGIHVSTKNAFFGLFPTNKASLYEKVEIGNKENWNQLLKNDFEETVFEQFPELKSVKNKLKIEGAFFSSMTGTGSTIYGLFDHEPKLSFSGVFFEKIIKI